MEKTAVEWLIDELSKYEKGTSEYFSDVAIKNKAFRMEKEQIIEAWNTGTYAYNNGEQYYNETFKSE